MCTMRKVSTTASFSFHQNIRNVNHGLSIMEPLLYVWCEFLNRYGLPDYLRGSLMKDVFEAMTMETFCVDYLYFTLNRFYNFNEIRRVHSKCFVSHCNLGVRRG